MASVNLVILIGNAGQGHKLSYTQAGVPFCQFTLATNEQWKDQNGATQKRTDWHRIIVWNKLAEVCGKWLGTGKALYVEGKLKYQSWTDQRGQKVFLTQIEADVVRFLDSRKPDDPQSYRDHVTEPSFRNRNA